MFEECNLVYTYIYIYIYIYVCVCIKYIEHVSYEDK